eukprot:g13782.t1
MERDRPTRWGRIFGSFFPMAPRAPVRAEEVPPPEAPRPEEKKPEEEAAVQFEMMQREWQNISMQEQRDYDSHPLGSCWEVKASSNSDLKDVGRNMHESSLEYTGPERALCGKLAWQGAWVGGGVRMVMVGVNGVTSIGQVGLRYGEGKNILTATLSPQDVLCAKGLSLGYEYIFRNARIQGLLDTDGKVSCCVHDAMGFGFSGLIDYARGDYKFGMVMQVAPQPEPGQQSQNNMWAALQEQRHKDEHG